MLVPELHGIKRTVEAKATREKVMNLASAINKATLEAIHKEMDGKKAVGVDGVNKWEYQEQLDANLERLLARMKSGSYRPHPSRRTYIDKPGSTKKRPLGISCYEDKLVEKAVAQLLEIVYEPRFLNCSYGFRPDRNCHQAIREVVEMVQYRKTNYTPSRIFFHSGVEDFCRQTRRTTTMCRNPSRRTTRSDGKKTGVRVEKYAGRSI